MTTDTERYKISQISSIFSINVSPLDKSRSFICSIAMRTLCRFAQIPSNPLVKSPITNFFSFPSVIFFTRNFFSLTPSPFLRSFITRLKSIPSSDFFQEVNPKFLRTFSGAKIILMNFRRRTILYLSTIITNCFNHKDIINLTLGKSKYV